MSEPATRHREWSGRQTEEVPLGPQLSVVAPIYNEAPNIPALHARLTGALDALGRPWELILVDDGSTDGSLDLLKTLALADPRLVVVELKRNYGQRAALLAGFEQTRGEIIVTVHADLPHPPDEIAKLIAALEQGHDVARGVRSGGAARGRSGGWSRLLNRTIRGLTGVDLGDYSCTLWAYRRDVVESMLRYSESATFLPALANLFARSVGEAAVTAAPEGSTRSKYSAGRWRRLTADVMTGASLLPIQLVTLLGAAVGALACGLGVVLLVRRLAAGPDAGGLPTLFAALFIAVGVSALALGLLAAHIGRIDDEVRRRPRFVVRMLHRRNR